MTLKEIKKKYNIKDQDIAQWFGYKNAMSYYNAKQGKTKIENGLVEFYKIVSSKAKQNNRVNEK